VAKNDNNPLLLNKEPVDIIDIINKTIEIIQLKYPEAAILVNNKLQQQIIQADTFHFANIIYNFLDNSIKYCDKKPNITIDLENKNETVIMKIADNGIGIQPKYMKQIFEKFFRVPESKRLAVNGFGLGLYYVKKICALHHWKLQAESIPGEGTVITLTIPVGTGGQTASIK
jgi:two-component system, OmpR family, phosphate regulon sensor histidine kinase PhoR